MVICPERLPEKPEEKSSTKAVPAASEIITTELLVVKVPLSKSRAVLKDCVPPVTETPAELLMSTSLNVEVPAISWLVFPSNSTAPARKVAPPITVSFPTADVPILVKSCLKWMVPLLSMWPLLWLVKSSST